MTDIITKILIKVILYLLVAIASFANYLPEIAELLGNRPKYGGSYKVINPAIKYTNRIQNSEAHSWAMNQSNASICPS